MKVRFPSVATTGIVVGSAVLAVKPLLWLTATWHAPGYDSVGWLVFGLVIAVFLWGWTSPRTDLRSPPSSGLYLLLAAAAVRLAAQLLAVDLIGALTLAVDVYALGLIAGLPWRVRAVSPFWLAAVFCFSLPLEPVLQRLLGYPLQHLSAVGACSLLQPFFHAVSCEGTRILLDDQDVLVDLPCSGAQLLTNTLLMFALLAALRRPGILAAALGGSMAVLAAWIGNSLRIAVLAVGTAFPSMAGGLDLTAQPWHDLMGLVFTASVGAVIAGWALHVRPRAVAAHRVGMISMPGGWRSLAGIGYAAAALVIVSITPRPVDVSAPLALPDLPLVLAGSTRQLEPLSAREQAYFTQFGGTAARAAYGSFALLTAGTRSPLRHLHGPEVCLEGAGHDVRYVGPSFDVLPTAVYRSRDRHGGDWRIRVSWISAQGHAAASVSEAVWYWLSDGASTWTMVQRITPWHVDPQAAEEFEAGVIRAFNLHSVGDRGGVTL